jgi:hypothetical protein
LNLLTNNSEKNNLKLTELGDTAKYVKYSATMQNMNKKIEKTKLDDEYVRSCNNFAEDYDSKNSNHQNNLNLKSNGIISSVPVISLMPCEDKVEEDWDGIKGKSSNRDASSKFIDRKSINEFQQSVISFGQGGMNQINTNESAVREYNKIK